MGGGTRHPSPRAWRGENSPILTLVTLEGDKNDLREKRRSRVDRGDGPQIAKRLQGEGRLQENMLGGPRSQELSTKRICGGGGCNASKTLSEGRMSCVKTDDPVRYVTEFCEVKNLRDLETPIFSIT